MFFVLGEDSRRVGGRTVTPVTAHGSRTDRCVRGMEARLEREHGQDEGVAGVVRQQPPRPQPPRPHRPHHRPAARRALQRLLPLQRPPPLRLDLRIRPELSSPD